MYYERRLDGILSDWWRDSGRKPLVLQGARQTGKSTSVREFGKRCELYLELNLERHDDLSLVRSCRSAEDLLTALASRHNITRYPPGTLLFVDEIQESAEAIRWLRFLHEDQQEIAVVTAGSLMQVRLAGRDLSFPVGRVTFRTLRPFSFLEFVRACGQNVLAKRLVEDGLSGGVTPNPVHEQAMELLRDYLLAGGMPEAVATWEGQGDLQFAGLIGVFAMDGEAGMA